ncbi:MAG: diacylglycerol/lipid kinase family protein [Candidatus Limnocylindria bacterium]
MPIAPLVIVNPAARGGRARRLVPALTELVRAVPGARICITRAPGDAVSLAEVAVREGWERVVAAGGDGTVQEVANGLLDAVAASASAKGVAERPSLGLLPMGNGNDLARSLGLPGRLDAAWAVAVGEDTAALDLGLAVGAGGSSRYLVSAGGLGFDAQVATAMARRRSWQRGRAGYLLTTLDELRRFRNRRVSLKLDDGVAERRSVLFLAITNGAFYGGGMRVCPDARTDDGVLDLCIVGDISRLAALQQIPNLYRGTHVRHPAIEIRVAHRVQVDGDPQTLVHLDGEPFGALPLSVEVVPGALRVAVVGGSVG